MNYPYVSYLKVEEKNLAKNFAEEHELYFASPRQIRIAKGIKPVIWISQEKILLQDLDDKNSKPFSIDLDSLEKEKGDKNLLNKCFSKFDKSFLVYDLTAGLCQDASSIASMGFEVIAFEKESWLYEFNQRCLLDSKIKKLKLINSDSLLSIKKAGKKDILFLDPMFELNTKAFAKKEIQFLRKCIPSAPEKELIDAALNSKAGLVIIKRHKLSKSQYATKPSYIIKGKVITFEVFDRRTI